MENDNIFTQIAISELEGFEYYLDQPLGQYSTWKIGGPGDLVVITKNAVELEKVIKVAASYDLEVTILGHASNVLISDDGIRGIVVINKSRVAEILDSTTNYPLSTLNDQIKTTVIDNYDWKLASELNKINIKYLRNKEIVNPFSLIKTVGNIPARHKHSDKSVLDFSDLDYQENDLPGMYKSIVSFDSGLDLAYGIAWSHKNNLTGLQWFAGIPGTIGGALFNNIHGGSKHFSDNFAFAEFAKIVKNKPKLIAIVGPGGVGKSTIISSLTKSFPEIVPMITTTTRDVRKGELNGRDRFFVSKEQFQTKIANNKFLEYEQLFGNHFYGLEKTQLSELSAGSIGIMDIDVNGANVLKKMLKDDLLIIYILPPSLEVLESRLKARKKDDLEHIKIRLEEARLEMLNVHRADYVFVNDNFEQTLTQITSLLNQKNRISRVFLNPEEMEFGYDQSILRQDKSLLCLRVWMILNHGDVEKAKYTANEWTKRKRIQPRVSCGSVFQSVSPKIKEQCQLPTQAAAYIIDQILELKGSSKNNVQISPQHANFIVNNGGGTAFDVLFLMNKIVSSAKEKLGITLHPEIDFLGFDRGEINF
jgi:guanylate kinase